MYVIYFWGHYFYLLIIRTIILDSMYYILYLLEGNRWRVFLPDIWKKLEIRDKSKGSLQNFFLQKIRDKSFIEKTVQIIVEGKNCEERASLQYETNIYWRT